MKWRSILAICCLLFPVHANAEILMPSPSRAIRLAALDAFWKDWKRVYLREGCGGAYVDTSGDEKPTYGGSAPATLTVSEAHGYGMLALVRMADRDVDAHRLFDGMAAYYRDHPTASDTGLMAWNQTRDCNNAPDGGDMSATDGDLDIALALQLADNKWGGYATEARRLRNAILLGEVTADGMMRLGDWATEGKYAHASRSSDFMPGSFAAFAKAGDADAERWKTIRDRGYVVWGQIADRHAVKTGLVHDFISGLPDKARPVNAHFLEGEYDGKFSWNALRYPWRLSLDLIETGDPRARKRLETINGWIQHKTGGQPSNIASSYHLNGKLIDDESEYSTAFAAMFAASAIAGSGNPAADQAWIDALWSTLVATPISADDYYGNTLKLMSMLVLTELWNPVEPPH